MEKMLAVIRVRGTVKVRKVFEDTMKMLRLGKVNSCVVVPDNPTFQGMVKKVRDYVTFGEITSESFLAMLKKRGRLKGDKRLTEETVKELGYDSIEKLASDIFEKQVAMKNVKGLKPTFRLSPPSGGFKSTKIHFPKGDLGYRGEAINDLIKRMI
jgi:large subunit ribosomal protein L30